jgi:hypothetical protein
MSRSCRYQHYLDLEGKFGWGGRIRTFTVLINSEVSYRLDHAPAALSTFAGAQSKKPPRLREADRLRHDWRGEGSF